MPNPFVYACFGFTAFALACGGSSGSSYAGAPSAGASSLAGASGAVVGGGAGLSRGDQGGADGIAGQSGASSTAGQSSVGGRAGVGGSAGVGAGSGSTSTGGAGGGAGGSGNGGLGSAGSAGTSGCTDPDASPFPGEYQTKTTTTGTNGAFTDSCDANGNLIEERCEALPIPGLSCVNPNPDPRCGDRIPTGLVVAVTIDCGGTCVDGACTSYCPMVGADLSYVAVDPSQKTASLVNPANGAQYNCTLRTDWQPGGYDCLVDPTPGEKMTVTYYQSQTAFCVANEAVRIQVGLAGGTTTECEYQCISSP